MGRSTYRVPSREEIRANQREALRNWGYTLHSLDDTFDQGLIEGRARQILYQSINARRLTAVLGAGASMAYGRLSWWDWIAELETTITTTRTHFIGVLEEACKVLSTAAKRLEDAAKVSDADLEKLPRDGSSRTRTSGHILRAHLLEIIENCREELEQTRHEIKSLEVTQDRLMKSEDFPGGDSAPMKLQVLHDMHELLRNKAKPLLKDETAPELGLMGPHRRRLLRLGVQQAALIKLVLGSQKPQEKLNKSWKRFESAAKRPEAEGSFTEVNKGLLVDERAHARRLLRQALQTPETILELDAALPVIDGENNKRDVQSVRSAPELYRILAPFRIDSALDLIEQAKRKKPLVTRDLVTKLETLLKDYLARVEEDLLGTRSFLTPSSRWIIPLLLELTYDDPQDRLKWIKRQCRRTLQEGLADSRRSLIAERFDPISRLVEKLRVSRFVTFNYDFEIERYFQDAGFRLADAQARDSDAATPRVLEDLRLDGAGRTLRDTAFEPSHAAGLVSFATGLDGSDAAVHHFHGRADETSGIIATDQEYLDRYMLQDEHRPAVDEAVSLLFSSRTMFFVGVGMTEEEVLRPLKQFVSDGDRRAGYRAVVLLTGDKKRDERAAWSATLYRRFGVHTIWHGDGSVPYQDAKESDPPVPAFDWLFQMLKLISALSEMAEQQKDKDWKDSPTTRLSELKDRLAKLDDGRCVLSALYGVKGGVKLKDIQSLMLGDCVFAAVHPGRSPAEQAARDRYNTAKLPGGEHLGFYRSILTEIIRTIVTGTDDQGILKQDERKRVRTALQQSLQQLKGAFINASANIALDLIATGHELWWREWQSSPPHRRPEITMFSSKPTSPDPFPRRFIRHQVLNAYTDLTEPEGSVAKPLAEKAWQDKRQVRNWLREETSTRVRAFDGFIDALATERHRLAKGGHLSDDGQGRRLLMVPARRGLGKGTFLSAFATKRGLSSFIQASWRGKAQAPHVMAALFANLSFASEVNSVLDMMEKVLYGAVIAREAWKSQQPSTAWDAALARYLSAQEGVLDHNSVPHQDPGGETEVEQAQAETDKIFNEEAEKAERNLREELSELPRLAVLRKLLTKFDANGPAPRVILVFSAAGLLLRADGTPKNGEIEAILRELFGPRLAKACIDVVLIGNEARLGRLLKRLEGSKPDTSGKQLLLARIDRGEIKPEAIASLERRAQELGLLNLKAIREIEPETISSQSSHLVAVHFPRSAKPEHLMIDNFPILGVLLTLVSARRERDTSLRNALDQLLTTARGKKRVPKTIESILGKNRVKTTAAWFKTSEPTLKDLAELRTDAETRFARSVGFPLLKAIGEHLSEEGPKALPPKAKARRDRALAGLRSGISNGSGSSKEHAEILRERLRYRYDALTQEDHKEWRELRRAFASNRFSLTLLLAATQELALTAKTVEEAASIAEGFINRVLDQVRTSSVARREETVLSEAMTVYERLSVLNTPQRNFDLQKRLLRVLSAVGSATSADVLERAPEIRKFFESSRVPVEMSAARAVRAALDCLVQRGLLFRIAPHPAINNGAADNEALPYRYATHRSVAHAMLRRFGTITDEPVTTNEFAPSLYASIPSGLARLKLPAYQFLSDQMLGFSQYPDTPTMPDKLIAPSSIPVLAYANAPIETQTQALRAALSMARSSFSIAVVSRFEDYSEALEGTPARPFFDEYKVRLRWLIRKAWELGAAHSQNESHVIRALYRDEIVWLYNEVGLTSLVQGNLNDAVAHLRHALHLNESIEGRDGGRQGARLSLNLAVTQIERGHPAAARARLERIAESVEVDDENVVMLAQGHIAVCDHLEGNLARAEEGLNKAVEHFRMSKDLRAFAVMSNHAARLQLLTDPDAAAETAWNAQRAAEAGGHEDVRRHILLTEVRALMHKGRTGTAQDRETAREKALPILRSVLRYAKLMGLRSLEVDALTLHGAIAREQDDNELAGRLLSEAMSVADRNDLVLRLHSAATNYGKLALKRGRHLDLDRLLSDLLAHTKSTGHRTEVFAIQTLIAQLEADMSGRV